MKTPQSFFYFNPALLVTYIICNMASFLLSTSLNPESISDAGFKVIANALKIICFKVSNGVSVEKKNNLTKKPTSN